MPNANEMSLHHAAIRMIRRALTKTKSSGLKISEVRENEILLVDGFTACKADIVCCDSEGLPLLLIDTVNDDENLSAQISPLNPCMISNALSYAYMSEIKNGIKPRAMMTLSSTSFYAFHIPNSLDTMVDADILRINGCHMCLKDGAFAELLKTNLIDAGRCREDEIASVLTKIMETEGNSSSSGSDPSKALVLMMNDFVSQMSSFVAEEVNSEKFRKNLTDMEKEEIQRFTGGRYVSLSRITCYVLMNKMVTYMILQDPYHLPPITTFSSSRDALARLHALFHEAGNRIKGFNGVFNTGIFDRIEIPEKTYVNDAMNVFIDNMRRIGASNFVRWIGYSYENVIPADDRRIFGEFYIPSPIAEFIVRWAVRSENDYVMDPGIGSGAFLSMAYHRLLELISDGSEYVHNDTHQRILEKLYGIDINPFTIQLSILNINTP